MPETTPRHKWTTGLPWNQSLLVLWNGYRIMIHLGFHSSKRAAGFIPSLGLLATLVVAAPPLSAQEPAPKQVDGLFITVPDPIRDDAVQQIKRKVEDARAKKRNIDIIVFDFNPNGLPAATKQN